MRTTTRGRAGHGGVSLPLSNSGNMTGRGATRHSADGELDDASGEGDLLLRLAVAVMLAWAAFGAVATLVGVL